MVAPFRQEENLVLRRRNRSSNGREVEAHNVLKSRSGLDDGCTSTVTILPEAFHIANMALPTPATSQNTWIGGDPDDSGKSTCQTSAEDRHHGLHSQAQGLTVSFRDAGIEVLGLGQDYGPTVASVVTNFIPSFGKKPKSTRVSTPRVGTYL